MLRKENQRGLPVGGGNQSVLRLEAAIAKSANRRSSKGRETKRDKNLLLRNTECEGVDFLGFCEFWGVFG